MSIEKNNRIAFWQRVRGICILAVIMIHCPSGNEYGVGTFEFTASIALRQIINWPVAIFIFMAGYFTNVKRYEKHASKYILTRGGVLLVPFCLWSTFYTAISFAQKVRTGENIEWLNIICRFVVGKAATPLYYIVVLLQLTILTPLLIRAIKKRSFLNKVLWLITPTYLIYIYAYNFLRGSEPRFYGTLFPAWFVFYYLGLSIKIHGLNYAGEVFGKIRYIVLSVAFSFVEAGMLIAMGCDSSFACSQIKVSSFLYAFCLCLWFCKLSRKECKEGTIRKVLHHVGDRSYGVFYVHCFILMILTRVYDYVGISDIWILKFTICFILTAVLSVLVVDIVNVLARALKIEKSLKWIGF